MYEIWTIYPDTNEPLRKIDTVSSYQEAISRMTAIFEQNPNADIDLMKDGRWSSWVIR